MLYLLVKSSRISKFDNKTARFNDALPTRRFEQTLLPLRPLSYTVLMKEFFTKDTCKSEDVKLLGLEWCKLKTP